MKLPRTVALPFTMVIPFLPPSQLITLRAAALVPPMTWPPPPKISMPPPLPATSAVPAAFKPRKQPVTLFSDEKMNKICSDVNPLMTKLRTTLLPALWKRTSTQIGSS